MLLAKTKLNDIEVLICKALIGSYIIHDVFSMNRVLREYNGMKEEIKNLQNVMSFDV